MIFSTRFSVLPTRCKIQSEVQVKHPHNTEKRRTKNGPSGDGKNDGSPLRGSPQLLLPPGISPTGTLDTEGTIEDGK